MTEVQAKRSDGLPDRVTVNAAMNYVAAAASLSTFVVTPFILGRLGVAAFGVWSLSASIGVYADLFRFGFGNAGIALVAREAKQGPEQVRAQLNTTMALLVPPAIAALVIGVGLALLSPRIFRVPDRLDGQTAVVFLILAVTVALSLPLDAIASGLAGYQRYDLLAAVSAVGAVLSAIANVVTVLLGGGIVGLTAVNSALLLTMHLARWRLLRRQEPSLRISPRYVDRSKMGSTSRLSGWFSVREMADLLIHSTDLLVVGTVLGVRAAAIYAVGNKLARFARMAAQPVSKLFFPHASALADQQDRRAIRDLVTDGARAVLLVGFPVCLTLTMFAHPIVRAWVGGGYGRAAAVLALLAASQAVFSFTETIWFVVAGAHHPRPAAVVTFVEAVLNLTLSVVLAHHFGVIGVALGTFLAVVLVELPSAIVLVDRISGVRPRSMWTETFRPHAIPVALTGALLLGAHVVVHGEPFAVIATCAASFSLYVGSYVALSATPAERNRARAAGRRLRGLLRRS